MHPPTYPATVPAAFIAFVPLVLGLFLMLPARRAVITAYAVGWLFLPEASYTVSGLPDITKISVTSSSVLLAAFLFDLPRITSFRARWFDLPALMLVLGAFISSLTNGLGVYDGLASMLRETTLWGMPYFLGRVYLNDLQALRELAIGTFISGLVYVPLCLYEVRMAPVLHENLYGFMARPFLQQIRGGGYRPVVFMRHGLQVAVFMSTALLMGFALWRLGGMRRLGAFALAPFLLLCFVTIILCKTISGWIFLLLGVGALALVRHSRSYAPVLWLAMVPLVYAGTRGSGAWRAENLDSAVETVFGPDRAKSFGVRLLNENQLAARARERPVFGWGGWGRSRVTDEEGEDVSTTDGLWIIFLGKKGTFGLCSFFAMMLLPVYLLSRRLPGARLLAEEAAPAVVAAVVLALAMINNLPNSSHNPLYTVIAGALMGLRVPSPRAVGPRPDNRG